MNLGARLRRTEGGIARRSTRRRLGEALRLVSIAAVLVGALLTPALAVNPDEVLADPTLEARARAISAELRCMVCQNQSIDDSNAELAKDLRVLVRERLTAGDSDQQVMDYIVSRYGDFVLLKPRMGVNTILLWGMPVFLLLVGGLVILRQMSPRRTSQAAPPLTEDEQKKLQTQVQDLLKEYEKKVDETQKAKVTEIEQV